MSVHLHNFICVCLQWVHYATADASTSMYMENNPPSPHQQNHPYPSGSAALEWGGNELQTKHTTVGTICLTGHLEMCIVVLVSPYSRGENRYLG